MIASPCSCKMTGWPSLWRSGVAGADVPFPKLGAGVKARATLWTILSIIVPIDSMPLPMSRTMTNGS